MIIVKAREKDVICECGGEVMIDGEMTYKLPLGIGYTANRLGCHIDALEYTGWYGTCLDCNEQVLGYVKTRRISKRVA